MKDCWLEFEKPGGDWASWFIGPVTMETAVNVIVNAARLNRLQHPVFPSDRFLPQHSVKPHRWRIRNINTGNILPGELIA